MSNMQSPTVSATPPTAPIPDLPGYLASAPLRDEHIQPVEKIGLALNCVARSDVPIGLLLTSRLRVIPTLKVRRIAMAGELLAYNPLFVERVSLTGCKVLLLHEFARLLTPTADSDAEAGIYEAACDLWINDKLGPHYLALYPDIKAFREEFIEGALHPIGLFPGQGAALSAQKNQALAEYYGWLQMHREKLPNALLAPAFDSEIEYRDPGEFACGKIHNVKAVMLHLTAEPQPNENAPMLKSNFRNARLMESERKFLRQTIETCPKKFRASRGLEEVFDFN